MPEKTHYGSQEYWERRYQKEPCAFEWYQGYAGLKPLLNQYIAPDANILQIGVGTSSLQEAMVNDSYKRILNVDCSETVVEHMKERHRGLPSLVYKVLDCRDMSCFASGTFDAIIDKGTLDAIVCGENSVADAKQMLLECSRTLRSDGVYMLITYGDPRSRLCHVDNAELGWDVIMYYLEKKESPDNLNNDGHGDSKRHMYGPYSSLNGDDVNFLCGLQDVHFAYVCKRK
eukprot:evm.model.scf_616EXC.3 EVM.evm.TU.scf_616EXC.3   scf_616EXC:17971-22414(+)